MAYSSEASTSKASASQASFSSAVDIFDLNNNECDDNRMLLLKSFEGQEYECMVCAAKMSNVIKTMIQDTDFDIKKAIPLQHNSITNNCLKKIIEWVEYHWDDPEIDEDFEEDRSRSTELTHWDRIFIDISDLALLYDITVGANFLDIKELVDVCAKHICNKIKGKSCEEVRQILNIENDFTPEEEEAIHRDNAWINGLD